mmetsp:Transcript_16555/g.42962  ORF Transcript_16555/g.42962 Transcript_16555/m.42962 type:complete len:513 (+) Transcript_16555:95-1633(+)
MPPKAPKLDVGAEAAPPPDDEDAGLFEPKQYLKWSWEEALDSWAGTSSAQLKAVRQVFREMYIQRYSPPSFTLDEWQSVVMRHVEPHASPKAEMAVQLLTTLLVNDRKVGMAGVDPKDAHAYVSASIRAQRGEASNLKMFDLLEGWFGHLEHVDGSDASLLKCVAPLWTAEAEAAAAMPTSWDDVDSATLQFVPRTTLTRAVIKWQLMNSGSRRQSKLQVSMAAYRQASESEEDLPELEDELLETFEEMAKASAAIKSHHHLQEAMSEHNKSHQDFKAQMRKEGSSTQVKKVMMQQFAALEKHFFEMSSDNEMLFELWTRVDLNSNGELGFSEISTFVKTGYPLLANMPALRKAFEIAATDDASGSKVIHPDDFRLFLGNVFYYNKIFLAFDLLDTDKDHQISRTEWDEGNGRRFFQKFLMVMDIEWDRIANIDGKEAASLSYNAVCKWYLEEQQHTLALFSGADGPLSSPRDKPLPRMFDADAFSGLIFHAAYVTRCGEASALMAAGAQQQ